MRRLVVFAVLAGVLLGPGACAVAIPLIAATLPGPACGALTVGNVPSSLMARTATGDVVRLAATELEHAATIITVGNAIDGVGRNGIVIALMAALTESRLRMLANTSTYPETAALPHDGDGSDHDSIGLFQMRPLAGWGTPAELMDSTYQARAFFGGPTGPNHGSPRGLLDITGWRSLPKGATAQAVEVSAYPDRYAAFEPVAGAILDALTAPSAAGGALAETTAVVFPLPSGTWTPTSDFGMRVNPVTGIRTLHAGADYAAASGTPILAAADGRVLAAGPRGGLGNHIEIEHTINGTTVVTIYGHIRDGGIHVAVGNTVRAGQQIGEVGSTGRSTGPHLHFEVHPDGTPGAPIDPVPWLAAAGATHAARAVTSEWCSA
ncbi:Peptidase M23 [Xylanimonas cellulosilytica DSM 15894]|uniref:Peptidase M23 n=1 Tax=Xylanimonas cellulosilytica (strain DSM 15894 / JCM 12276 / CECT 5975 / KCTC 9989 / LMG 20990 / NBRC 107835 / XIL07) TaxID=446471 RepID=D1BY16_XYLCX|nr:M23 family metallopeptidase [Xylanimonas cellulosilytica]ACZ29859.1 Peptidase M23 [Xylanimonas cellulosilytica DSM 15894]